MSDTWHNLRSQIERFYKPFPKAAIAFANTHREEVTPYLIGALEQMAAAPSIAEDEDYVLHLYAMHLLAAWREPRAFAAMVSLGHHDEETVEMMMGDTVTESYGRCLASVCGGDIAPLKALFENTQASYWARNAALDAMMLLVLQGDGSRDDLIAYLTNQGSAQASRLLDSETQRGELEVIDCIVSVAAEIGAVEMLSQIKDWFDAGLVETMLINQAEFEKEVFRSFETCREAAYIDANGYVSDVESEIGWWSGFAEEPVKKMQFNETPIVAPTVKPVRTDAKIGRNDPCPCGSGKKYKKCHGAS